MAGSPPGVSGPGALARRCQCCRVDLSAEMFAPKSRACRACISDRNRRYRESAKGREYHQEWWRNNGHRYPSVRSSRDVRRAQERRRRALRRGASGAHTERDWQHLLRRYGSRCAYCPAPATTRDHVVPLVRGGTDYIGNILPACLSCNSSKSRLTVTEWRLRNGRTTAAA